ncbi:heme-binding NEAT domain protein [Clostridium beijerinckii]|uniref:hypothetical protein n=1 Tax=Clostridium beijerinckii TaxID=1520 RepID=UPI00156EB394|nr:hypothetical protein [Clostridium beijerinckii]NRT34111.1 heme-binding NEAT domain protein [Clostridium beijerinckii]NRT46460.1 heme-binding NEAT domain protein [Clostridium beijerinckii]NRZ19536.1 heme-binding NEAT domain protein [Clostridium beijerinckii]
MNIIKKVQSKVQNPAKKNGELMLNDIFLVKDEGKEYIHMFVNNDKYKVIEIEYEEKLLNELKQSTWTVEKNGTTVKSNSFVNYTEKDIRLTKLLQELNLPKYHVLDEEEIEKNIGLYNKCKGE